MRVLAVLIMAALAGFGGAGAQPERSRATLTPRSLDPLVLQGEGFKRRERVRVTLTPGSPAGPNNPASMVRPRALVNARCPL
jgi:hypothetical protein